jgi:hypothetical protein
MRPFYYDRGGRPIDVHRWAELYESSNDRRVAADDLPGGVLVSTVFLGIDHNFDPAGPPLIFETMVFGGPYDQETWRYATEAQALATHRQIVAVLRVQGDPTGL